MARLLPDCDTLLEGDMLAEIAADAKVAFLVKRAFETLSGEFGGCHTEMEVEAN